MHIETRLWTGQTKGQNSGSDYGNRTIISKFFETVPTNRIYHVICRFSQLSLQCFVIRIGLLPHSRRLQAKNQVQLDILGSTRLRGSADVRLQRLDNTSILNLSEVSANRFFSATHDSRSALLRLSHPASQLMSTICCFCRAGEPC